MGFLDDMKAKAEAGEARQKAKLEELKAPRGETPRSPAPPTLDDADVSELPSHAPRYDIEVVENVGLTGVLRPGGALKSAYKYRWIIYRDGEPYKVGYGVTYKDAYKWAKAKAERIESRRLKKERK